jgi:hypothetical protein
MADSNVGDLDLFGQAPAPRKLFISKNGIAESTLIGRYAEFMVCAYLTRMGYNVMHVDAAGYDLMIECHNRPYRIDVKATSVMRAPVCWKVRKKVSLPGRFKINGDGRRDRPVVRDDCDMLALFHLEFNTVVFYPVLAPVTVVTVPLAFVKNSGDGQASLEIAIQKLR